MTTNVLSLRIKSVVVVRVLSVCFLLVTSCSIGAPNYSKHFLFEPGEKRLEISVDKYCTYEIGISFSAKGGEHLIKDTFGGAMHVNLPAKIDIFLSNDAYQEVFSKRDFGGSELGFRYGPNPIMLIAGKAYLIPGKYTASINIKSIGRDLSDFDSDFFLAGNPKLTCKKMN
ncbi:MAG: hypothetical protein LGR52_02065 [Candidatus Thiosymbion ectosymbiont of Robbea hypermnestra]|nr:hypothetical protein [Candidatus Thiosymbion ectosymbiont of Robbea hypermnestra]